MRTPAGVLPIEAVVRGGLLETIDGGVVRVRAVHPSLGVDLVQVRPVGVGRAMLVTAGHPFLTVDRGWVAAAELRAGDALCGADGGAVELLASRRVTGSAAVWSLELEWPDAAIVIGEAGVAAAGSARSLAAMRP